MKYLVIALLAAAVVTLRVRIFNKRRSRRGGQSSAHDTDGPASAGHVESTGPQSPPVRTGRGSPRRLVIEDSLGDVGIVAVREIRERVRGRIFRVGTLVILLAVAAAIIIPTLHKSSSAPTPQAIGVVGTLSQPTAQVIVAAARENHDSAKFLREPSSATAEAGLRSGKLAFAIVDEHELLLNEPATLSSSPADPSLVADVADYLGVLAAYSIAGLTPSQAAQIDSAKPVPVRTLQKGSTSSAKGTSVIGVVLLFLMLTQYNTWILIGVMQEKSSRVVEVLLATLRPMQLLGGKVLGIGLVALGQAALIVGFALAVGAAVGSDLLHGAEPLVLACELLWLILGYAFYCWVYAAAGSMAERQDQVQTLALPLSIPILVGYVFSITVASTGNADLFFKVLAYLPPTAPFCMSVLVGLRQVTWWEFLASVLIAVAGTAAMAIAAAGVYRRAVLRTGSRVHLRELFAHSAR